MNPIRERFLPAFFGLAAFLALASHGIGSTQSDWKAPARAAKKKNPVPADQSSITTGRAAYEQQCVSCHGPEGKGDGPAAKDLPAKVRDLADPGVLAESDGAIFWKLAEGREPMPSYEKLMTEEERWNAINYLRFLTLAEPRRAASAVLEPYLAVQSALVKDDLEAARAALPALEGASTKLVSVEPKGMPDKVIAAWKDVQAQLPTALSAVQGATDLASFRIAFATLTRSLSAAIMAVGHATEKPLLVFECSKALPGSVATWIQVGDQAQNPYLGAKAPTCAEGKRGLDPAPLRGTLKGE